MQVLRAAVQDVAPSLDMGREGGSLCFNIQGEMTTRLNGVAAANMEGVGCLVSLNEGRPMHAVILSFVFMLLFFGTVYTKTLLLFTFKLNHA